MSFNADKYLSTLKVPAITIEGVTYTGKQLSFNKTVEFQKRFEDIDSISPIELQSLLTDVCNAINIPADKVLDLPPSIALEAINDFFMVLFSNTPTSDKKPKK